MSKSSNGRPPVGRREQVVKLLREVRQPLDIAEIAGRLGIHVNTARFHLDTLVHSGQVERTKAEASAPGRPPLLFQAARTMDPMGARHYRMLAEVLTASMAGESDPSRRAREAGRAWGRKYASAAIGVSGQGVSGATVSEEGVPGEPTDRLVQMLDEFGFVPEKSFGAKQSQIGLRNCPFLELAVQSTDVVCPIHLGLMQGAMQSWDSPVTVERLDPFVEPNLCMVHLGATHVGVDHLDLNHLSVEGTS